MTQKTQRHDVETLLIVIERLTDRLTDKAIENNELRVESGGYIHRLQQISKQKDELEQLNLQLASKSQTLNHVIENLREEVRFWKDRDLVRRTDSAWRNEEPDSDE